MKLVRFGARGINLDTVRSWQVRHVEGGTISPTGEFVSDGTTHDIIDIFYVTGDTDAFTHEEATLLRQWLEGNAEDISKGPPSKEMQIG
jgi:hypothetical protein